MVRQVGVDRKAAVTLSILLEFRTLSAGLALTSKD